MDFAGLRAELADAVDRNAALERQLASLTAQLAAATLAPPCAATAAARSPLPRPATTRASLAPPPRERLLSPSRSKRSFLGRRLVALVRAPVSFAVDAAIAPAFEAVFEAGGGSARGIMREKAFYAAAVEHLPACAERFGGASGDVSAATLFTTASLRTSAWVFASDCKPELHARGALTPARPFRAGFNGAIKSAGDSRALEQAAYYAAMDLVRIFFPARGGGAVPGPRRFFSRPPLAFAIVGFPHTGYYIALEMVGKLLVSPASRAFLLRSAEHAAIASALPDPVFDEPRTIDETLPWVTPSDADDEHRDRVAWVVAGGVFQKIVRGDARSASDFVSLYAAYARLSELLPAAPRGLALPAFATLAFGAHEVLIELPAVDGCDATDEEVTRSGRVLDAVAAAIAWLARGGVVYTDLRGPNVLVSGGGGGVTLVDFDDCLVADAPVLTLAAFKAALAPAGLDDGGCDTFAGRLRAGDLPDVDAALEAAFAAEAAAERRVS